MKKFLTLLLAAAMTLSLAACGSKTDDNSGNNSQPASALELNANTFTAGAFHVASSSDVDSVVSDLKDNIMNRQWMCGFPDKLVILTLGDYVVSCYGAEDLVDQFSGKVTETFADAAVVCDEAIA